jgi:hypothetical protein
MTQGPVLVFDVSRSLDSLLAVQTTERFDVRASLEDVLDTWGPGQIFRQTPDGPPLAIKIGGGYICPSLSHDRKAKHHWDRILKLSDALPSLNLKDEIIIGSLVELNLNYGIDEGKCWQVTDGGGGLKELGVYSSFYESTEAQLGVQGGLDHITLTTTKVWAKRPGRTVKAELLEGNGPELISALDFYWDVRLSFCTGVAQRLPLRSLVADLHPAFVYKSEKHWWRDLENNHRAIETLSDASAT